MPEAEAEGSIGMGSGAMANGRKLHIGRVQKRGGRSRQNTVGMNADDWPSRRKRPPFRGAGGSLAISHMGSRLQVRGWLPGRPHESGFGYPELRPAGCRWR